MGPALKTSTVLLLVLAGAWHFLPVQSCSDVMWTNTSMYDAVISGRNYDFFAENVLTAEVSAMPSKTKMTYTPLLGCDSPSGLSPAQRRIKYGFICVTFARPETIAGFWDKCGLEFDAKTYGKCKQSE